MTYDQQMALIHRAQGDFVTTIMTQWARLLPASVKVWLLNQQKELYAKAREVYPL